jgi:hypothetical protein
MLCVVNQENSGPRRLAVKKNKINNGSLNGMNRMMEMA